MNRSVGCVGDLQQECVLNNDFDYKLAHVHRRENFQVVSATLYILSMNKSRSITRNILLHAGLGD